MAAELKRNAFHLGIFNISVWFGWKIGGQKNCGEIDIPVFHTKISFHEIILPLLIVNRAFYMAPPPPLLFVKLKLDLAN